MSIFKGDSIYKSGGGSGGGYNDGGALVDADFIEVQNNTISTYDNTNRDPVNLYFSVKDGEIINSVVELTTAVNATINVYVERNGFLYLLGNVGGNTVNAGDDYTISVTGDSYIVEQVSGGSSNPLYAIINGQFEPISKTGSLIWTGANYNDSFYSYAEALAIAAQLTDGWRLPTESDIISTNALYSNTGYKLKSTSGWFNSGNGDNSLNFNGTPDGVMDNGTVVDQGKIVLFHSGIKSGDYIYGARLMYNSNEIIFGSLWHTYKLKIRFVKDI